MSRCFPFPPPGYERQHVPEDLDLLKEAKRKEKKHKKEKDKERKKEKEKGKDKSVEKQKDKKERKKQKDNIEKHKDDKSKEDRSKDKEKSSISEESTVSGVKLEDKLHPEGHSKDKSHVVDERTQSALFQGQNGQKLSHGNIASKGNNETKFVQELDRRIKDDGARGSQLPSLVDDRDQRVAAAKAAIGNSSALLANDKDKEKSKRADDMQKIGNLSNGKAGIEVDRNVGPDSKKNVRLEVKEKLKDSGEVKVGEKRKDRYKKSQGKEKDKEKHKKEKKEKKEKEKVKTENKKSKEVKLGQIGGKTFVSVLSGPSKEVNNGKSHEKNLRKRKDMCINGFGHEMETTANKIQRPAPPQQSMEIGRKMEACRTPTKSYDEHTAPNSVSPDGKSRLTNGFIKGKEPVPFVLHNSSAVISQDPVPALSKIPKGKEPLPSAPQNSSAVIFKDPVPALLKIPNDKERLPSVPQKYSAVIFKDPVPALPKIPNDKEPLPSVPQKSSAVIFKDPVSALPKIPESKSISLNAKLTVPNIEDLIAEALKRPPHPDSKYLSEVLTIPSVAGLSEDGDQDWMLTKRDSVDKLKDESVRLDKEPRVWSEAVRIESADICALPFVIPY